MENSNENSIILEDLCSGEAEIHPCPKPILCSIADILR